LLSYYVYTLPFEFITSYFLHLTHRTTLTIHFYLYFYIIIFCYISLLSILFLFLFSFFFFFFFQAEDGIRDYKVTGVQTCALPISPHRDAFPVVDVEHDAGRGGLDRDLAGARDDAGLPAGAHAVRRRRPHRDDGGDRKSVV